MNPAKAPARKRATQADPLSEWINDHPRTVAYIAGVVTLLLILQIVELVTA